MAAAIEHDVALQSLNTLAVPSVAQHFVELENPAELTALLEQAHQSDWQVRVLGQGSNVVLADRVAGLVIHQCCQGINVLEEHDDSVLVEAAAGENWHDFVKHCLKSGWHGLENLALIPGTVGAAPIQNIGAYGVEAGSFIDSVDYRDLNTGEQLYLSASECEFGYRDSIFKHSLRDQVIIESVCFQLPKIAATNTSYPSLNSWLEERGCFEPTHRQVFDAVSAIRSERLPDPQETPNAGSFFKNPVVRANKLQALLENNAAMPYYGDGPEFKLAAAWLIEQCGFKQQEGRVRVHPEHALVIINPQRCPAAEIEHLAGMIQQEVERKFGLILEQEPRSYG
jgi:UDP-N-acetylmuramate dehydrogenase